MLSNHRLESDEVTYSIPIIPNTRTSRWHNRIEHLNKVKIPETERVERELALHIAELVQTAVQYKNSVLEEVPEIAKVYYHRNRKLRRQQQQQQQQTTSNENQADTMPSQQSTDNNNNQNTPIDLTKFIKKEPTDSNNNNKHKHNASVDIFKHKKPKTEPYIVPITSTASQQDSENNISQTSLSDSSHSEEGQQTKNGDKKRKHREHTNNNNNNSVKKKKTSSNSNNNVSGDTEEKSKTKKKKADTVVISKKKMDFIQNKLDKMDELIRMGESYQKTMIDNKAKMEECKEQCQQIEVYLLKEVRKQYILSNTNGGPGCNQLFIFGRRNNHTELDSPFG